MKLIRSQLNKTEVNEELINEFIKSANEVTKIVNFCNKVASDTVSNYNQLKQEFDGNNKFNQNITNIHLDDMFTAGLREFKEEKKIAVNEGLIKNKKKIVQYIIALFLDNNFVS